MEWGAWQLGGNLAARGISGVSAGSGTSVRPGRRGVREKGERRGRGSYLPTKFVNDSDELVERARGKKKSRGGRSRVNEERKV